MSVWKGGVWASQKFPGGSGVWKGGAWLSQRRSATATQVLRSLLFGAGQQGVMYVPQPIVDGQQALFQDSAGTTPVTADGQPVGYIKDLSGSGNHATQATAAAKPLYPDLETDGVDDSLGNPYSYGDVSAGFTVAISASLINTAADDDYVIGLRDTVNANSIFGIRYASTAGIACTVRNQDGSILWQPTGIPLDTNPHVIVLSVNSSELRLHIDGALVASRSFSGTLVLNTLRLGAIEQAVVELFAGANISGAVVVKSDLPDAHRESLESYLANLSGVTLP